jgi:predicted permease
VIFRPEISMARPLELVRRIAAPIMRPQLDRALRELPTLESILQDVRYGARSLRRAPVFTAVAVLSIAGGLAAGTAVFATMNALLFRSIAVGDPGHLYRVFTGNREGGSFSSSSYADLQSFMGSGVLASACGVTRTRGTLSVAGVSRYERGELVTPGCFRALQVTPSVGRLFGEEEAASAPVPPIVIGYRLWQRRFGGDSSIVGRTILLNGTSVVVVGVAPPSFAGTSLDGGADFWAPTRVAVALTGMDVTRPRGPRMFNVFARLRDTVSVGQAEAALRLTAARLATDDPRNWTTRQGDPLSVSVVSEVKSRFQDESAGGIAVLIAGTVGVIVVLVGIACVNLATMLLARGAVRAREFSVRLALGASRGRVLRQMATESLLIAAMGIGLALAAVSVALKLFDANRPAEIPAVDVQLDWRVVTFAIGLAVTASLLFGLAPAFHTLRLALSQGMKGSAPRARGRRFGFSPRDLLIVVQVGVSMGLLLVATLFTRALGTKMTASPGFETNGIVVMQVDLEAVPDSEQWAVAERAVEAARRVPGVEDLTSAGIVPLMGTNTGSQVTLDDGTERVIDGNAVGSGYFNMVRIPIRSGRDFTDDDRTGTEPVAIVNETMARQTWGTTSVVGRTIMSGKNRLQIVGVVADTKYRQLSEAPRPLLYRPAGQSNRWRFYIHARMRMEGRVLASLEDAVRAVDRRLGVSPARSMRDEMDRALAPERITRMAGAAIGAVQLGLAMMALWGLVAYTVSRRTSEMGIRLALGATPTSLVRLVMRPAAMLILIGAIVGGAVGAAVALVIQSESSSLPPLDPAAAVPIAIAFAIVAMAAAWWPARRAGMADPARSLKAE